MTLIISLFAAIASTVVWYFLNNKKLMLGMLVFMFWGASIMWLGDLIMEYREIGAEVFTPALEDLVNDAFLGLCVVALALIIWLVVLLIKDPKGTIRGRLKK